MGALGTLRTGSVVPTNSTRGAMGSPARVEDKQSAEPGDVDDDSDLASLTLHECRPGLWVEVRTQNKHITWRAINTSTHATQERQVCVKWLGECKGRGWPKGMPDNLFTWMGGSHNIHIETIHNVSDNLFHVARRGDVPLNVKMPPSMLKEDADLFCLSYECHGRCTNSVAPNKYRVPSKDPPKTKRKTGKTTRLGKRKMIAETKPIEKQKPKCCFVWEPNITNDCKPSSTHTPITYIRSRVFSDYDGSRTYFTEPRHVGKCHCTHRVKPNLTKLVGKVTEKHSDKMCAYRSLHAESVNYPLYVVSDDDGTGNGIQSKGFIPKGQLIMEYVGEIITVDEAARRDLGYAERGLFYLHDIHGQIQKHTKERFCTDPAVYGNAARLFNHSCKPNVTTLEVLKEREENEKIHNVCHKREESGKDTEFPTEEKVSNLPRVSRIGLFTMRDVAAGEMLTIDYLPGRKPEQVQKKGHAAVSVWVAGVQKVAFLISIRRTRSPRFLHFFNLHTRIGQKTSADAWELITTAPRRAPTPHESQKLHFAKKSIDSRQIPS